MVTTRPSSNHPQSHIAHQLLSRAHSPDTAEQLFTEKVKLKPLYLRPTSPTPADNRARRRLHRLRKKEYFLRKQKPKPLTAREKRILGVHGLPKEEVRYETFKKLNGLWVEYMWEMLELKRPGSQHVNMGQVITATGHGAKLASADFHGAELQVVRSRCVSRVGVKGIVVRDSKFAFVLVTEKNELKTIPKEHTVFRFEIPAPSVPSTENGELQNALKNLVFELHGSQFENRPADRANKKFKWKNLDYL
ncbi:ribonuclease P subunit [Emydomyces testavorans]|uniref:Ribonuclease P protein subunit n=1 Tax=Emydomyces testavorans TaxID=2070801 RepID=A0AAF0IKC1_9EURO|nr:ribonuclease P subunit [Emydomyces testavorans]